MSERIQVSWTFETQSTVANACLPTIDTPNTACRLESPLTSIAFSSAELHEKAFRRLGGTTRVVVLDTLREGVLAPDVYDPTLNPLYKDLLQYYAAVALLAAYEIQTARAKWNRASATRRRPR